MKKYVALILATLATPSFADNLALDLNDDALRLNYQYSLDKNYNTDFAWTQ
jgi:hypothetical protein